MATVLCPTCRGVVLMSAPNMKLIGPPGTELRHILATCIMCPCGLDLWPIFHKIGSRYPEVLMNVCAYLEVHRHFSLTCHDNQFVLHSLGAFLMLASKYELDTTTQYWVITIFNSIRYVTLWPWPLTFWPWSNITWCHLGGQSLYQVWTGYDLPFQS